MYNVRYKYVLRIFFTQVCVWSEVHHDYFSIKSFLFSHHKCMVVFSIIFDRINWREFRRKWRNVSISICRKWFFSSFSVNCFFKKSSQQIKKEVENRTLLYILQPLGCFRKFKWIPTYSEIVSSMYKNFKKRMNFNEIYDEFSSWLTAIFCWDGERTSLLITWTFTTFNELKCMLQFSTSKTPLFQWILS